MTDTHVFNYIEKPELEEAFKVVDSNIYINIREFAKKYDRIEDAEEDLFETNRFKDVVAHDYDILIRIPESLKTKFESIVYRFYVGTFNLDCNRLNKLDCYSGEKRFSCDDLKKFNSANGLIGVIYWQEDLYKKTNNGLIVKIELAKNIVKYFKKKESNE